MKKFAVYIRKNAGRKSIPANFSEQVLKNAKTLAEFYKFDVQDFDIEKKEVQEKRPVVWCNSEEILDEIIQRRNSVGNFIIKVMADGGKGFFKVCMCIILEYYVSHQNLDDENAEKRLKPDKMTSVHKLIMLCIVPNIKESYDNVKKLFELIKINDIPFKFVADFKLLLIINRQQTARATFPCPYCFVSLQTLKTRSELENHEQEDQEIEFKTYGDLRKDYEAFTLLGGNALLAMTCHSTVNAPLFQEPDDMPVIEKCVVPELHVMQGIVNHIFWKGLVPLLGREKALIWPRHLKLISKSYHGDSFEGNACRKMLKNLIFYLIMKYVDM